MKKRVVNLEKSKKRFIILVITCISILCISLVNKQFQNDTFYSIKLGKFILNNGIDMKDHFSIHNLAYTYPHWLYDVFIYLTYKIDGFLSVYIFTIILFILLIVSIFVINLKINKSYIASFASVIICSLVLSNFAVARAQLLSYIVFIWVIYFIECLLKKGDKKYIIYLLISSIIICNIHLAVWPFYFLIYLPYIVEYLIYKFYKRFKKDNKITKYLDNKFNVSNYENIKYLFVVFLLSLLTGLMTPLYGTPYTYIYKTLIGNSQNYIQEHLGINFQSSIIIIIIALETIILGFISKFKLSDLFLFTGLIIMAISSTRHLALLALFGPFCLIRTFTYFLDYAKIDLDKILPKITTITSMGIIITITSIISIVIYQNVITKQEFIDTKMYPKKAVEYIKNNLDYKKLRLFNEYDFGSYLLLNDIPVFIDSRADLYTKQFSHLKYDIFDDYMHISNENYKEMFEFYNINSVLLYKSNVLNQKLKKNHDYKKIYEDSNYILYIKKDG